MNSTGDKLSPCGEPMEVSNYAEQAVLTRTVNFVSDSSSLVSRSSSSLHPACSSTSRIFARLMVSKARDMSMPILWKSHFFGMATDISMR